METVAGISFERVATDDGRPAGSLGQVTLRVHKVDGKALATWQGQAHKGPIGVTGHDLDNALANARALFGKEKLAP